MADIKHIIPVAIPKSAEDLASTIRVDQSAEDTFTVHLTGSAVLSGDITAVSGNLTHVELTDITATNVTATTVAATSGTLTHAEVTEADITTLTGTSGSFTHLASSEANSVTISIIDSGTAVTHSLVFQSGLLITSSIF